ncbi:hypothetical protein [Clostridium perfringens]|mgnify:CR=1 FL=1|uniref:hypothetical protein n=1 Tax=Clostridium perfringens TaxID=1502 RepID=UPI00374A5CF2
MKLILNEYDYVKSIIKTKDIKTDTTKKIIVLIKYYREQGINKDETLGKIQDFMMDNYPEFNLSLWDEFLSKLVKTYHSNKHSLRKIDNVHIYKEEMDYITRFNNPKLERILFIMLVYAKIGGFNGWINTDISNVFRDSKTSSTRKNMYLYIHKLKEHGIVDIQKQVDGRNVRIEFMKDGGEDAIIIDDFRDVIMYYYEYKGMKVKKCEECEIRFLIKNKKNTSQKYCKDCSTKVKNKKHKERNKRWYEERR